MNNTEYCEFWPKEPSRCHLIAVFLKIFSSLSLAGCLFVIAIICLFKLHNYFVQRLILFLCISAGIDSLNLLMEASTNLSSNSCKLQAFVMQFFNCAELFWICSIAINVVLSINQIQISKREKWIHFIVWFLSLLFSVLPLIGNHYGQAGFWCWISREANGIRFVVWYIPLLSVIVSLLIAYIYLIVKIYKSVDADVINEGSDYEIRKKYDMMLGEVKPLIAYPVIYFCFHLPMLITRLDDTFHPNLPPPYSLAVAGVICAPSLGLLNAIAFALYGETLKLLTWNHIKGAILSYNQRSVGRVTHNYLVLDNNEIPLLSSDEEKLEYGSSAL